MTAEEARTHLRYSAWASQRLLDAALKLDSEQLHRETGTSHKSIYDTLGHIHMADRAWLFRVLGTAPESSDEPLEVAWPVIQERWRQWSEALTDADMTRVVSYQSFKGDPFQSPVWQIVMHVVNHATLHRGQVMGMLRQLEIPPPPTDLIFYYRQLAA